MEGENQGQVIEAPRNVAPNLARDRCAVIALQMALRLINPDKHPCKPGSDEDYIRMVLDEYRRTDLADKDGSPWWTNPA